MNANSEDVSYICKLIKKCKSYFSARETTVYERLSGLSTEVRRIYFNRFSYRVYHRFGFNLRDKVKPVYNDHPRDPKFVTVVDRWSLFRGNFMLWNLKLGLKNGGRYRQVVVARRWSLAQVWLYLFL